MKTDLLSPLQQFKSNVNVKDLQCKAGLSVVVKKSDNSPACVTSSAVSSLMKRNWGMLEQKILIQNTNSTVTYYAHDSKLDQIVSNIGTHELTLFLKTTNDDKITLFLPRSFTDSQKIGDYT